MDAISNGSARSEPPDAGVPVRRIFAFWGIGVAVVGGTILVWSLIVQLATVLGLVVVALFFAIVLTPAVDFFESHTRMRRGLATLIVFLLGVIVFGALGYAFARPVYDASSNFTKDLPQTIRDAERGRGDIGRFLRDIHAQSWARDNLPKIQKSLGSSSGPLFTAGRAVVSGVIALLTVLVLTFLMLMQAPNAARFGLSLFPSARADRIRRVGGDAARAVTGYIVGNVIISLIAGVAFYICALALGVPFAFVLALWVAFADLLPLVGATLGAVPAVFVAFLQSPAKGIAVLVFFIVYQQFENHVLQTTIMARTVKLNPLAVLLAVLIGVDLAGLFGALLAIPVAGALQVIVRDVWDERHGRVKEILSVGADENPMEPIRTVETPAAEAS